MSARVVLVDDHELVRAGIRSLLHEAGYEVVVANQLAVTHVRGVSSRARPFFVEWHKHRGLWRYFNRFEAPIRGVLVRGAVFLAIWLRFPLSVLRAALRR